MEIAGIGRLTASGAGPVSSFSYWLLETAPALGTIG